MKHRKIAIITGAGRGIGKAISLKLDREGFFTIRVDRMPKNLKTASKEFNKRAMSVLADVSREQDVVLMIKKVVKKFNRIDVLVNNAGLSAAGPINQMTKKDFNQTINVNLGGAFYCMRECINQMKKQPQGGQIINIGSIAAKMPFFYPNRSIHCASKAAVASLAASIQTEMILEKKNIKIATIHPGPVLTDWLLKRKNHGSDEIKEIALKPEDVAHVVWMIANQGKNSNISEVLIEPLFASRFLRNKTW
jgi:NADP-dependent 3-hydroxy acid dehydrogenase YdfG